MNDLIELVVSHRRVLANLIIFLCILGPLYHLITNIKKDKEFISLMKWIFSTIAILGIILFCLLVFA